MNPRRAATTALVIPSPLANGTWQLAFVACLLALIVFELYKRSRRVKA